MKTKVAILSFPGNNCEVESLRAIKRCGMEPVYFKWNDSKEKLTGSDGYFIPGGFSYEDRGRAGMVAARDPLLTFIGGEAERGKVVIGVCNGAQVLVESGIIPLDAGLKMSLAKNAVNEEAVGFLNEWVWITPTCKRDRAATSDWEGVMHLPIAHAEGRFTTKDKEVISELKKNDQIAFSFCDGEGNISDEAPLCPNGSLFGAAGICNRAGNVIALMPHPERSPQGDKYFLSMKRWIEEGRRGLHGWERNDVTVSEMKLVRSKKRNLEIFIETIIVNNEERTVEQAARRVAPRLKLKQLKYVSLQTGEAHDVLSHLSLFNPNKEIAYVRRGERVTLWNHERRGEDELRSSPLKGIVLLRRDDPDTLSRFLGEEGESGICYVLGNIAEQDLYSRDLMEVFANPHASTLELL